MGLLPTAPSDALAALRSGLDDSLARAERTRLCDCLLRTGPDAPTLCDGWTTRDLLVHLLVRERRPWAAPGMFVPALSGLLDRAERAYAGVPWEDLVARFRSRGVSWAALAPLDGLANTAELFVHFEDVRRAAHDWEPRQLSGPEQDRLWRLVTTLGPGLVRGVGVPVVAEDARTGTRATLRRGADPAVLRGEPAEVLLHLFGRTATRGLQVDGSDRAVRALADADLSA